MGYELNQLMKRYGLSTRTISPYSGVAAPTALAADATAAQKTQFDLDSASATAQREAYDKYKSEYQNRIASTSAYQDSPLFKGQKQNWETPLKAPDYSTIKPNNEPVYSKMVNDAYAGIGRKGIGTEVSNIDQTGYDYWMGKLQNGAISPADFNAQFTSGVQDYTKQNPDDKYTKYVQGYLDQNKDPISSIDNTSKNLGLFQPAYDSLKSAMDENNVTFAHGGPVRHFYNGGYNKVDGGIEDLVGKYDLANPTELPVAYAEANTGTKNDAGPAPAGTTYPVPANRVQALDAASRAVGGPGVQQIAPTADVVEANPQMTTPSPVAAAPAAPATPAAPAAGTPLEALYQKYLGQQSKSAEMATAEKNVLDKKNALIALLKEQASKTEDNAPSKAEMYFRLAAALAAPTKTGNFMENVGLAAKELADFQKSTTDAKKSAAAAKLQLMLKTGEIDAQTAEKELANLKEGEKERRDTAKAFATEEFRQTSKLAEPQTTDEKDAAALGYKKGTPEFTKFIQDREARRVKKEESEIKATEQRGAASVAETTRKAEEAKKLSPAEVRLKDSLSKDVATQEEALRQIQIAIDNSPKAYDATLTDTAKRKFAENKNIFGGKPDPAVTATERMEQALASGILQSAASMKGALSDKDLAFLRQLSGVSSKSKEARLQTLEDARDKLLREIERSKKQQADVAAGLYREKTSVRESD